MVRVTMRRAPSRSPNTRTSGLDEGGLERGQRLQPTPTMNCSRPWSASTFDGHPDPDFDAKSGRSRNKIGTDAKVPIIEALRGSARVDGRIAPTFDLGVGLDPGVSGYENILFRGLFLGMTRARRLSAPAVAHLLHRALKGRS